MPEFEAVISATDGNPLSLSVSLPETGIEFPTIFDCHPYRKDDLFSFRGAGLYEYFLGRGFATARLDVRGTGRSRGCLPLSEYSHEEIGDCVAVIDWLASQPWSNGAVGMWGISWSAINTLLVAARRPPALRACIAVHPSDELFTSDIHYIDGLFHYDLYHLFIDLLNGVTAGPDFPLDEDVLEERFDQPPWMASVLLHQRNDAFWRQRSLAPRWDRISCPVFLVGGWYDGYHECVFRLLEHLNVPVEACIGPWSHVLPHMGGPGPAIDWLRLAADWWDRWLRDRGADSELVAGSPSGESEHNEQAPPRRVQIFARSWHEPGPTVSEINGEWRTTRTWPIPAQDSLQLNLAQGSLVREGAPASAVPGRVIVDSSPWIGWEVGHWWGDVAFDQALLDAESETFDLDIDESLEILGAPRLVLSVSGVLGTNLFARLCDVAPSGQVTLVTGAGVAIPAERLVPIDLPLHWTSWCFEPGHRLRLSLSTALWPMFWPGTRSGPVAIRLDDPGRACLHLPLAPGDWGTDDAPPEIEAVSMPGGGALRPTPTWEYSRQDGRGRLRWATAGSQNLGFAAISIEQQLAYEVAGRPDVEALALGDAAMTVSLPGRDLTWRTSSRLEAGADGFSYRFRRELLLSGSPSRTREWRYDFPRATG